MATIDKQFTLVPSKTPRLPAAPQEYDAQYFNALNNILRLYFQQIDNYEQGLASSNGGRFLSPPYGAFQDTTTQTAAANTATALKLNTTDFSNTVTVESLTKIRVKYAGIYNLQFSVQAQNANNASHDLSIWLRQGTDGGVSTDIPGSTGLIGLLPRSSSTNYYHLIAGWNYFVSLTADDYIQIFWSTDSTLVTIEAYAAGTSPTRPSTASVVVTMSFVSALPVA